MNDNINLEEGIYFSGKLATEIELDINADFAMKDMYAQNIIRCNQEK